jgi:hypothetical protein
MTLLSSEKEVKFTYARLKDGTIVESPTFDVNEPLEVVSEDGTKTPAPDGEHELTLKDESGNENIIKVITKDGVIAERENVELETEEAKEIPAEDGEEAPVEMEEATIETAPGDIPTTGDGVSEDEDETEIEISLGEIVEKLQYRIDEMEKKIAKYEETAVAVEEEATIEEEMEEEELPKLDGAPIEAGSKVKKFSLENENKVARNVSPQERVLAKLYNK